MPISAGIMTVDDTSDLIALTNRGKHVVSPGASRGASCRGPAYVKLSPSSHNCSPPISAAHPQMGFDRGHLQQKVRIFHQIWAVRLPGNKSFEGGRIGRSGFDPTKPFRGWRGGLMRFQLRKIAKGRRFLSAIGWHAILTRPGQGMDLIGRRCGDWEVRPGELQVVRATSP